MNGGKQSVGGETPIINGDTAIFWRACGPPAYMLPGSQLLGKILVNLLNVPFIRSHVRGGNILFDGKQSLCKQADQIPLQAGVLGHLHGIANNTRLASAERQVGGTIFEGHRPGQPPDFPQSQIRGHTDTPQTGPAGQKVKQVLIEEATDIDRELYLGIVLDRTTSRLVVMASRAGGMDIEQVAAETPEKILKETIDPGIGLQGFQARRLAFGLGLEGEAFKQCAKFISTLA